MGAGTALAILFAPKPGVQMRSQLRAATEDGIELVKDTFDQRDDLIQAGKQHLKLAMESGRAAYRRTVNLDSPPEVSALGTLGVLAFGAAAVAGGYQLVRRIDLPDASPTAVTYTGQKIAAVISTGLQVIRQIEKVLAGMQPQVRNK